MIFLTRDNICYRDHFFGESVILQFQYCSAKSWLYTAVIAGKRRVVRVQAGVHQVIDIINGDRGIGGWDKCNILGARYARARNKESKNVIKLRVNVFAVFF